MPSQSNKIINPFADLIGITFIDDEQWTSLCTVEIREDLLNPNRVLHGGVSYTMADTGMAYALIRELEEDLTCATVEIKITYLRPATEGTLRCNSWLVSRTRRLAFTEAEVFNGDRLIAKASGTFSILGINANRKSANG